MEKKNPVPESLRQSEVVYSNVLATPATTLEPCVSALAIPMDHSSDVKRAGWRGSAACPLYLFTQALSSGEVTPASLCSVDKTREVAVYVYKSAY